MNHLSKETSPYLLQHAHNPVEWYAWKPEAFARAQAENKPILVSIGYSTCHWCHVMERESFENEEVAALMNKYFINIKVDREERPDVDQIYMEACQIISGGGGWPLNCFLTPDARPFFAGTYYPPQAGYNRPSWTQLLSNIANAFYNKRETVESQANQLTDIITNADKNYIKVNSKFQISNSNVPAELENTEGVAVFKEDILEKMFYALRERFDKEEGGFGGAPKFPGTMCIQFLLDYYAVTKNQEALDHAQLSLKKMIQGGIYDQLGGGFARYATDREWLIPHFEKMLYDNALLINVISDAYKLTKEDIYRETIEETLAFVDREMTAPPAPRGGANSAISPLTPRGGVSDGAVPPLGVRGQIGGFYSAYDADSEGVEGKFYVWEEAEIEQILGEDAPLFCAFYDVTEEGNWEEHTILWRHMSYEDFAKAKQLDVAVLKEKLKIFRQKLYEIRDKRIKPGLDNKIQLSWNALMISAYAKSFEALNTVTPSRDEAKSIKGYKEKAIGVLDYLLEHFAVGDELYHTNNRTSETPVAFLEDYAYLIEALLDVYEICFDKKYLDAADRYTKVVLEYFLDKTDNMFYFTSSTQTDLPRNREGEVIRKKDLYDNATPSGNSTMAKNLLRLGIMLDNEHYKQLSVNMLQAVADTVRLYPSSFAKWASVALSVVQKPLEIAVVGDNALNIVQELNALFLPNKIVMASVKGDDNLPLLKDRYVAGDTYIYVCRDYACQMPVKTIEEFLKLKPQ
jgi:uncharacterized protein